MGAVNVNRTGVVVQTLKRSTELGVAHIAHVEAFLEFDDRIGLHVANTVHPQLKSIFYYRVTCHDSS